MNTRKLMLSAAGGLLALLSLSGLAGAADRPYTEGPVSVVSSIRTEPGMFDEYMKYLDGTFKQAMEAEKKAGLILDYRVYSTTPRGPDDPDLYLVTVYKDMAAMDGLAEKMDPIQQQFFGDISQRSTKTVERGKLRTAVGSQMLRKLELK
jgi:hypothetical protein